MYTYIFVSRQFIATSAEIIPNWGLVGEPSLNEQNSQLLGRVVDCTCVRMHTCLFHHKHEHSIFCLRSYMGVSENSGTPKSSILIGFSIINHTFWDTPIFGNTHIYIYIAYIHTHVSVKRRYIQVTSASYICLAALGSSTTSPGYLPGDPLSEVCRSGAACTGRCCASA